jgi:PIN domain nuclease of toxin-antitoxin system
VARLRLLLDTHIWLWSILEPSRISRGVTEALNGPDSELWLSPISVWEALLLHRKGRVQLTGDLRSWIADSTQGLHEATLTQEVAVVASLLPTANLDPADRFIAATAQVSDLTLITADKSLLGMAELRTLAN